MAMSGGPPEIQGVFTIAAGATVSNKINANGRGLAGVHHPAAVPGGAINVLVAKDGAATPSTFTIISSDDGTDVSAQTLNTEGASSAVVAALMSINPQYFHKLEWVQLTIDSSSGSSAIVLTPVWY